MRLTYVSDSRSEQRWVAATTKGGYDGWGPTPLDAVSDLVTNLERELGEDAEP